MTNTIAIGLGAFIVLCVGGDLVFNNGDTLLFLAIKTTQLVDYVEFWR